MITVKADPFYLYATFTSPKGASHEVRYAIDRPEQLALFASACKAHTAESKIGQAGAPTQWDIREQLRAITPKRVEITLEDLGL